MLKNIISQSIYQIVVLLSLVFVGEKIFNIPGGTGLYNNKPTQHYTIVFNTYVMMTLCNEFNSRKLHGERNVFQGLFRNAIFCFIWILCLVLQVIIVEFGDLVFFVEKLTALQWTFCIIVGASTLVWYQIVVSIPMKRKCKD